jgi:Uma2 family endonuclease
MSSATRVVATLDDLSRVEGKAELIAARIVHLMPTGFLPNLVAGRIYRSLAEYADATGRGVAFANNMGFAVPELSSGRESFSPDAAFHLGPLPSDQMNFVPGAPTLAVEVRSKSDYGDAAEEAMAAKRTDYFLAGTLIVWDVDPIGKCIRVYHATTPDDPAVFKEGQLADAEPAVPGWRVAVDDLFR